MMVTSLNSLRKILSQPHRSKGNLPYNARNKLICGFTLQGFAGLSHKMQELLLSMPSLSIRDLKLSSCATAVFGLVVPFKPVHARIWWGHFAGEMEWEITHMR